MIRRYTQGTLLVALLALSTAAGAVSSSELYQTQSYRYGRFEARLRFAAGDGVISSFFLWKPGSEVAGTFWNELDFEKLGADCHLQTNPLYGAPVVDHSQIATVNGDLCGEYHTYEFEWTPTYIAYRVDGVEVRRDVGEAAAAFATNATGGMQIHFNIWPGDATFGGNFNPAILPVHQYISWVQYSSFADGVFRFEWREDFAGGTLPSGWSLGNWPSPKNLSTHQPANATFVDGFAVLSLSADDATGFGGTPPADEPAGPVPTGGSGGDGSATETPVTLTGGTGTATNGGAASDPSSASAGASKASAGANSDSANASNPTADTGSNAAGGASSLSPITPPFNPLVEPSSSKPTAQSTANCGVAANLAARWQIAAALLGLSSGALFARRRSGNRTMLKRRNRSRSST